MRNPVQVTAVLARSAPHDCTANAKTLEFPRVLAEKLGDTGFDSSSNSAGNHANQSHDGAHSGARGDVTDAQLARLIEVWPALSDDVKAEILALVGLRPDDVDDLDAVTSEAVSVEK